MTTAETGLPDLPAGQMHFAIKTHDGKTHIQVMPTPKELPVEGDDYSTELPKYGKLVLKIVMVTDKLIACREIQPHEHSTDEGPGVLAETHPIPSVGTTLYEVIQWCDNEEGVNPTQVHLLFPIKLPLVHLAFLLKNVTAAENPDDSYSKFMPVMRLKSRRACTELIEQLTRHRDEVFPGGEACGRVDPAGEDCEMMKPCPLHEGTNG